ncbi:MAG: hypothetical protein OXO50_17055 [Caldilineaceae bacterium]|nr:hypothetical protein [Caldilineaceae bacterium]
MPMLFPGIGLAEDESSWTLFHITPLAPDRSRVVTRSRTGEAGVRGHQELVKAWAESETPPPPKSTSNRSPSIVCMTPAET